jgi:hypothetical protein
MKTKSKLLNLIIALSLFSNCLKEDCDNSTENKYVDKNYLPYIIPYTDTSTRLFLKNGKDTLLFKSQGLKETIEVQIGNDIGNCKTYKLQQYSLKMAASDTDFFEVKYYADKDGTLYNNYEIINGINFSKTKTYLSDDYVNYFPIIYNTTILNNRYDSIKTSTNSSNEIVISKPKIGVLKIKTANVLYELIK